MGFARNLWLAAALGGMAAPAQAALDFTKPADIVQALQALGYRAKLDKLKSGKPYIASAMNGNDVSIYLYECDQLNLACKSFEFYAWWKKRPGFTPELANKWNIDKRFMRIAIDSEGDLEQRLYASGVAMTETNFKEYVDWYASMEAELGDWLDKEAPLPKEK